MSLFAFVSQPWNAAAAAVYPVRAPFPVGSSSSCCMEGAANCSPPLHFQRALLIAPPPPLPALHLFICIGVKRRGGSRVVLWAHKVKCWLPMLPSAASSDYCNYTNKSTPTLLWFIDAGMEIFSRVRGRTFKAIWSISETIKRLLKWSERRLHVCFVAIWITEGFLVSLNLNESEWH